MSARAMAWRRAAVAGPAPVALASLAPARGGAQEARRRWERLCQIRAEKFDLVLPEAMHDNHIGDRVERAVFGVEGYKPEACGVYDHFGAPDELPGWIRERDPKRIGVDMAESIGGADGLSHTSYLHLRSVLGVPCADRLVSAEKLVSHFRSTRTATASSSTVPPPTRRSRTW